MKPMPSSLRTLALLVFLSAAHLSLDAATITWTNVNGGLWSASTNWSPNQVPGNGDTAMVTTPGTYTVTLDVDPTVAGFVLGASSGQQTTTVNGHTLWFTGAAVVNSNGILNQDSGTVHSGAALTINGLYRWTQGIFAGTQTVGGAGVLSMESGAPELQGTITNGGTMRWSGGTFFLEQGSTVVNLPGATFQALADGQGIVSFGGGVNQFINQGTFQKSGNADQIGINVGFINSGTVQVQAGTLSFPNGFASSGNFDVSSNAVVRLDGGTFLLSPGHTFTGAGFYGVLSGSPTVVGDLTAANFQLNGGSLTGTNRVTGTLVWRSGALQGILTIAAGGAVSLENGGPELRGIITNAGTMRWNGGPFYLEQGSTVVNLSGGTFQALADGQSIVSFGGGVNQFINQGTFQKSGNADQIGINVGFINSGTVQVQAGTLSFPNGFASSGNFDVSSNAVVRLDGGTFLLSPGHTFTGAGFYGVLSGAATLVGDLTAANFQLNGGSLTGTNRVAGTLVWRSGALQGILTIAAGGVVSLENGGPELRGIITNAGTMRWNGGPFYLEQGSTVVNLSGGTFQALADGQSILSFGGGVNQFINQGTFRKSGNPDTITVAVDFVNLGILDIEQGTLSFGNGLLQTTGSTLLNGGALSAQQPILIQGGSLAGAGSITATVTNAGQLVPGIGHGQLSITGDYIQTPGGALSIELAGPVTNFYGQLAVSGTASLAGTLTTILTNNFVPTVNTTFPFLAAGTLQGTFAQHRYPSNIVALQLNYTPTSATLQVANIFTNASKLPPVFNPIADQLIAPGRTVRFQATATDLSVPPQPLVFSLGPGAPAGATIDPNTGVFSWLVPAGQPGGTVTITVRVTENGGNSLSASQLVNIVVDRQGPRVLAMSPTNQISALVDHIELTFQKAIDPASLATNSVTLSGPSGPVAVTVSLETSNVVLISFATLPQGAYSLQAGPNIMDLAGNLMDQNSNGINGEPVNDVFSGQLTVGLADLLVSSITAPAQALIGQPVVLSWTVNNQGNVAAVAPWSEGISLADDASGANAQTLAIIQFTNTLPAGQSITRTQSVILPSGIFGQKFFVIQVDLFNQVNEGFAKTNNVTVANAATLIRAPDLVPTSLSAAASAQFGQTVNLSWTVQNTGNGSALANWNDTVYLTPASNSLAGGTVLLAQPITNVAPLSAGGTYTLTQPVTLPPANSLPPGQFYLTVSVDDGNNQPESNEANNLISRPLSVSQPPLPDLAVLNITAPASAFPGQQVQLQWTVTNQGTFQASGPWSETVSFSNSPPLATFTFTNTIPVGSALTRTQTVTIPFNDASGNLYLTVEVDSNQQLLESNKSNNLGVATQAISVPSTLTLSVSQDSILENAAEPNIQTTVTRNGDRSNPLVVNLASGDTTLLTVPANVTIPAGQVSATFDTTAHRDFLVRGPQLIPITATAAGFIAGTNAVTVIDVDLPSLRVAFGATNVLEGSNVDLTVTRDVVSGDPVVVTLASSDLLHLSIPTNVTIAANQPSVTVQALAVQTTLIEGTKTYMATASAPGYTSGSASIAILNNNVPQLSLQLAAHEVSEAAGAQATTGTVTRNPVGPRDLVVALQSDNLNAALVPSTVTIPAAATSATFPVAAVRDNVVAGTRTARIEAFVTDSATGARLGKGAADTLSLLDADGPSLQVSLNRTLVAEGRNPAATGTVTRNAGLNTALTVTLGSSDTNAITVPAAISIPAGSNSVSFPIASGSSGLAEATIPSPSWHRPRITCAVQPRLWSPIGICPT